MNNDYSFKIGLPDEFLQIPLKDRISVLTNVIDELMKYVENLQLELTETEALCKEPNWSTAPEWANWWAVDSDGEGTFFEYEPMLKINSAAGVIFWDTTADYLHRFEIEEDVYPFYNQTNFHTSLTKRPQ